MGWQCRERQMMMREDLGRPGPAISPEVFLPGEDEPVARIITVISKRGRHSLTPEFQHMARRTNDPAARRDAALMLLSEYYYQKAHEFADMLSATFAPRSATAGAIRKARQCRLVFEAHAQHWELACRVRELAEHNPLWQATFWHNKLFNPGLTPEAVILGFEPDWSNSQTAPAMHPPSQI